MFMFCDYDDFDNVNVVALVMQIIFEAGIMMTIKIKMAIILPTGQWYAPSAVINDAW